MHQIVNMPIPIPSCPIHSLNFEDGIWSYNYEIETNYELSNQNKIPMAIYGHISDLYIVDLNSLADSSINLAFITLDQYKKWLTAQAEADNAYRKKWKKEHPDMHPHTFKLENRSYSQNELKEIGDSGLTYIASKVRKTSKSTTFTGI